MAAGLNVFIKYNGHWVGHSRYVGCEMKGILVPTNTTYMGLIDLVRNVIGIGTPGRSLSLKYVVEDGEAPVKISSDYDVTFYLQLKKRDVHLLNKFPICVETVDESMAQALPPEIGESSPIPVKPSRVSFHSDEAEQNIGDCNMGADMERVDELDGEAEFPIPPIPLTVEYDGIDCQNQHYEELDSFDVRGNDRNKGISNGASGGAQSVVDGSNVRSDRVQFSDDFSGGEVIVDYTPRSMRVKNVYNNKRLLQYHLHHDAMNKHYQFKVKRSSTTLLHVVCVDEKCHWQVRATRMKDSELFVVKRFDEVHTCSIEIVQGHHRQASSWMIGECVKAKFVDLTTTAYRPREIMRDMQGEFGVSFNYLRAWRGKEAALNSLRGDDAESYQVLPSWGEMVMRKNPGSDIHIETDAKDRLKYFYMCLAASKQGWPHCRPVIVVDASALKARYGGTLFAACGHDADGSIFPIAFSIGDSENNDSWEWFFTKLRDSIGMRDELAIVADRHKSIEYAVKKVYPEADFGICVQHLARNLKARFKGFKGTMKSYFDGASRTYLRSEFERQMGFIQVGNPAIHRYLLDADPVKWSRAFFNGRRYSIMTTNIAESLNNVDRNARFMPVGYLVEWLRELLQRWFVERREAALKLDSTLSSKADKRLRESFSMGLPLTVRAADHFEYSVTNSSAKTWIVDMREKTCTCRQFQLDQLPCPHVMAVCNRRQMTPASYCSKYYMKEELFATYEGVVHLIGSQEGWDVDEETSNRVVNPPNVKRRPGRPSLNRILSQGEVPDTIKCSRCHSYGHNRKTCPNPIPLHPGSSASST